MVRDVVHFILKMLIIIFTLGKRDFKIKAFTIMITRLLIFHSMLF
jgi:hypothetical protein